MNNLAWLEIDLGAIKNNVLEIKKIIGSSVSLIAVVKSHAYGHGLVAVSKMALRAGASWLAVFNLEEGLKLREAGVRSPILILGFVENKNLPEVIKNNISLTLYDISIAKALSNLASKFSKKAKVHLKIDTGMHRLGVLSDNATDFVRKIKNFKGLEIEGIFSHFAESTDKKYSLCQLEKFKNVLDGLKKEKITPKIIHMANSAGTLTIKEARFNAVRCGLAMYGLSPFLPNSQPALSFKAKIIQIKDLKKGDYVGYQKTYQAKKPIKIAVLGVGYADGYDRGLSNKGEVLVKGIRCPVIGRICMNQTIINLKSRAPREAWSSNLKVGDTVTLIGKDGSDRIEVAEIAEKLNTIPHEVVSRIPENVPRIYYE
jgi:alanine racemase